MSALVIVVAAVVALRSHSSSHASLPVPTNASRPSTSQPRTSTAQTSTAPASTAAGDSPLAGDRFWIDTTSDALQQVATWRAQGKTADATALTKLTSQPFAVWLSSDSDRSNSKITAALQGSAATGTVPLFVVYDLPNRDCGGYSSGGATSATAYEQWVTSIQQRIGSRKAVIVLEPDAVANAVKGCAGTDSSQQYALLAQAVQTLKQGSATSVYLDAGNPRFIIDPDQLVAPLQASGIAHADGFALNVANFQTTADNIAYGEQVSTALGGTHFVIDTSRNGSGPLPAGSSYNGPSWCNPPGRTLGQPPTTSTGSPVVDALLWIKRPGESDGDCGVGDPPAGQFWPQYALALAGG